jgi:hypothetical protein
VVVTKDWRYYMSWWLVWGLIFGIVSWVAEGQRSGLWGVILIPYSMLIMTLSGVMFLGLQNGINTKRHKPLSWLFAIVSYMSVKVAAILLFAR